MANSVVIVQTFHEYNLVCIPNRARGPPPGKDHLDFHRSLYCVISVA